MKKIIINTRKVREVVDITDRVQEMIGKNKLKQGTVTLFIAHTTAGLTTADLDPGTDLDLLDAVWQMIPKLNFRHAHDPAHTPSHIASSIVGSSLTLVVEDGQLILGTWQRVVLVELDGPKDRNIFITLQP